MPHHSFYLVLVPNEQKSSHYQSFQPITRPTPFSDGEDGVERGRTIKWWKFEHAVGIEMEKEEEGAHVSSEEDEPHCSRCHPLGKQQKAGWYSQSKSPRHIHTSRSCPQCTVAHGRSRCSGLLGHHMILLSIKTQYTVTMQWRMAAKRNRPLLNISTFNMYSKITKNFLYSLQSIRTHYLELLKTNSQTMTVRKYPYILL